MIDFDCARADAWPAGLLEAMRCVFSLSAPGERAFAGALVHRAYELARGLELGASEPLDYTKGPPPLDPYLDTRATPQELERLAPLARLLSFDTASTVFGVFAVYVEIRHWRLEHLVFEHRRRAEPGCPFCAGVLSIERRLPCSTD